MKIIVETNLSNSTVRFLLDDKEDGNESLFYEIPIDWYSDGFEYLKNLPKVEVRISKNK